MIRQAKESDITRISELYCLYIEDSFFVHFGKGFLKELFKNIIISKHALCFVYEIDGKVQGFITGAFQLSKLFREMFFRKCHVWAIKVMPQIIRYPSSIKYIIESFLYSSKAHIENINSELLFIAIEPEFRKKGVASLLVDRIIKDFRNKGVSKVKVATVKNNKGVNKFLESYGAYFEREFKFYGKNMILYIIK
ncbi:MAG: GNAT family N-acetyltransferase [Candidatus Omnitrophica bacterium]|nr:GNAT family N-acetyltransferase [Candidatus Omnitrophota bacterium]